MHAELLQNMQEYLRQTCRRALSRCLSWSSVRQLFRTCAAERSSHQSTMLQPSRRRHGTPPIALAVGACALMLALAGSIARRLSADETDDSAPSTAAQQGFTLENFQCAQRRCRNALSPCLSSV